MIENRKCERVARGPVPASSFALVLPGSSQNLMTAYWLFILKKFPEYNGGYNSVCSSDTRVLKLLCFEKLLCSFSRCISWNE